MHACDLNGGISPLDIPAWNEPAHTCTHYVMWCPIDGTFSRCQGGGRSFCLLSQDMYYLPNLFAKMVEIISYRFPTWPCVSSEHKAEYFNWEWFWSDRKLEVVAAGNETTNNWNLRGCCHHSQFLKQHDHDALLNPRPNYIISRP